MVGVDGDTGEAEIISEADLARLLDRTELQEGDEAFCADELLGEVNPDAESYQIVTTKLSMATRPLLRRQAAADNWG